ncbi:hypothetical protein CICLE_v10011456mg [Citrus x clementina]|uniref:DUF4378 domain-containing protein n=1 Tax=Citrus clementina TaxID=85681 RepID=V4SWT7_CITCL|nr:uncharacterized protein LOC18039503 isoform X1 [Citrus x clementina]ESR43520.1 hypothetical protein CICLE_v10011456mg [Citrus x clementina]
MMAQKQQHLHELLKEDQEPFQLKNYIADRRCQLKGASAVASSQKTQIQVKKRKPISQTTKFPSSFCKNVCFFSFHDSPADPRKSPLFEFPSPAKGAKSPCRSPNKIFLQVPARTAALLLEAALRVQKQSSKQKTQNKKNAFGLFGSLRRKLTNRNIIRKRGEGSGSGVKVSVKDILRWDSSVGRTKASNDKNMEDKSSFEIIASEMRLSRSCSTGVWSESDEDNNSLDLDLETSCSSHSNDFEEQEIESADFASCDEKRLSESPFRFVLQTSPSPGRRTPDFTSPEPSPIRHKKEEQENHEIEIIKKFQGEAEDEEEEKEQCSPVSVLDPPFEDDDEGHGDEVEDVYDLECSYAIVQRAKKQLLHKLRRFEKLAELDPIELEKRILEQEQDYNENDTYDLDQEEEFENYEPTSPDGEKEVDEFVKEVLSKSNFYHVRRIPEDMKRLVVDLLAEEEQEQSWSNDKEAVVKRVCRRLESWKEVESNTIDMMVEHDLRREHDGWRRRQELVGDTALEIEFGIFGLLMEELSEELVV